MVSSRIAVSLLLALPLASQTKLQDAEAQYYKIVTFPFSQEMPMEVGAMTCLKNGQLLIGTRRGDVYRLENPYVADTEEARFTPWARGLAEDLGVQPEDGWAPSGGARAGSGERPAGDLSSLHSVPAGARARGRLVAKAAGTLAGLGVFARTFELCDPAVEIETSAEDGQRVRPGDAIAGLAGDARALLLAERTALNFLQRMSGIATLTARYVELAGGRARILDTRKTTPGLRAFDKYAVRCGGGENHRFGLFDEVMIKDNHVDLAGRPLAELVRQVRAGVGAAVRVTVEARDEDEARAAVLGGADVVLLDNMSPGQLSALCPVLRRLSRRPTRGAGSFGRDRAREPRGLRGDGRRPYLGRRVDALGAGLGSLPRARIAAVTSFHQEEPGPHQLRLDLPAAHSAGRMARQVVRQFALREGLHEDEVGTLELVTSELLSNAVDHGGGNSAMEETDLTRDVRMTLLLGVNSTGWELRVADQGGGDPSDLSPYLDSDAIPDFEDERGRGFYLLVNMVDEIKVDVSPDGRGLEVFAAKRAALLE